MDKLEIDSVHLSFGNRVILKDVYLECKTGDVIGLIGRNGSGKSSLMKLIFGLLKGDHQSVRLNGRFTPSLFHEKGSIHFLPQNGFAIDYLQVDEVLKSFEIKEYEDEIYSISGMYNQRKEKIGNLSGGLKKMIEVLTVVFTPGKFVMLDEPFSNLSPLLIEQLIPLINQQAMKKGIILCDHFYETVLTVCDQYYILYEGALKKIDHPSDLRLYGYVLKNDTTKLTNRF